ncbi:MAG: glycosyl hydrolase 115 family protein [Treponema sp.]|nr:glycosyl hydrolase 115 family protein [Treponema sp.]
MQLSNKLSFVCSSKELSGVKKIAQKVCMDVNRVFGFTPQIVEVESFEEVLNMNKETPVLLFGTAENSALLKDCETKGIVNLSKICGKNEVYNFCIKGNLIAIAGSDKRGAIYGLFHFSELIGVCPLVDWDNIQPVKQTSLELEEEDFCSKEPSVKYRGFFINDEWPAFGNWANHNFGGVNAKMYEHVFELLLRLKGNYLWPAMWASRFSDDGPDLLNAELADELGVIMGASHHEPCCRAGEEYKHLRGKDSIYGDAWNFRSNEKGITKFWEDGLKRNGRFENVITVGMRGEADTAIMQNATLKDNIDLLRDVLKTQNRLIKEYVNPDVQKVPRMLALYKEVEPYFYGDKHTKGLMDDPELDGVTLMLCDDNHGNLRTVPTEKMRNHKGGYGMYYHFDYHGWPYSFEWINTSYLPKVKEQMCAAYDFGIRDLWIVNVGDIMTNEFPLSYFLDLAYDYEKYSQAESTTQDYTKQWICKQFPALSDEQKDFAYSIIDGYTKIAHLCRTECIKPETFSSINNNEADRILNQVEVIIAAAEKLKKETEGSPEYPGIFAQIVYPACGTMNVLRMQLLSGKNRWFAKHNMCCANLYADKVRECVAYDKALVAENDTVDGGRFYAMGWSEHFGFNSWCEAMNSYPSYIYVEPTRKNRFAVWVEGNETVTSGQEWTNKNLYLDAFRNPEINKAVVNVGLCCQWNTNLPWNIEITDGAKKDWLSMQIVDNDELQIKQIILSVDRAKLEKAEEKTAVLKINGDEGRDTVFVNIDAQVPSLNYEKGTFIQTSACISMEAEHFAATGKGKDGAQFMILPGYGKTLSAVKAFPVINEYKNGKDAPYVQYNFVAEKDDLCAFDFYLNPSNPAYKDNKEQFIVEVNGQKLLKDAVDPKAFAVGDNNVVWGTDIANNIRISTVYQTCKKGLNVLRVYPVTPNIVLEKIVIHSSEYKVPYSYLGAEETYRVK